MGKVVCITFLNSWTWAWTSTTKYSHNLAAGKTYEPKRSMIAFLNQIKPGGFYVEIVDKCQCILVPNGCPLY